MADDVPNGYGNVRVSFSGSRNVTQGDKDAATIRVFFNDREIEKKNGVFEGRLPTGTRLAITAESVSGGRIIGKGEESITVKSGSNNVPVKIYTYDNFIVTIDGKATGYTTFTDAWDAANGKTATIKMNADATNVAVTLGSPGNVTLDLNGHTITGNGTSEVVFINGSNFVWTGKGTIKQPSNSSSNVIYVEDASTFNMYDVTITGGNVTNEGGGVFVYGSSTFNMYGGSITGNKASTGGGVFIEESGGTFNWYDGTISGNTATGSGNNVYVSQGATYTRNGVPQDTSQDVIID